MEFLDPSLQDRVHGTVSANSADAMKPLLSGAPDTILWIVFATALVIFFGIIGLIMRSRVASNARYQKAANSKFFQPAGEEADITFDEEDRAEQKRAKQKEILPADELEDEDVAEVIIERPDEPVRDRLEEETPAFKESPPAQKKKGVFAGLFAKKKNQDEDSHPPETNGALGEHDPDFEDDKNDPFGSTRGSLHREEASEKIAFHAEDEAEALKRRAEAEAEAIRRRAEEDARLLAEENAKRIAAEEARRIAEREAEFERRKQEALLEQRAARATDAGQERAEIEERLAALSDRLDKQASSSPAFVSGGGGDNSSPANADIELIFQRLNEHREAVDESLASMSQRLNQIAGAPSDVEALRADIAELRGALGGRVTPPSAPSVQLADIVRNALPPDAYEMNALLPNNRKADCLVRLPHPPGPVAIDARFPVEAYNRLQQSLTGEDADAQTENEFRRIALRHVVDIAERMIVPDETADSALMFVPSESIYTELHSRFADVVQDSYRARVWIVSPTTLMATLHTIRAIVRDAHVRESADFIHAEAREVLAEVEDLRQRVGALEKNFDQTRNDVREVINSTDQVFRRAETITRSGHSINDPAAVPTREPYREKPPLGESAAAQPPASDPASRPNEPDLWENETGKQVDPPSFPLR